MENYDIITNDKQKVHISFCDNKHLETVKEVFGKKYEFICHKKENEICEDQTEIFNCADNRIDKLRTIADFDDITIVIQYGKIKLDYTVYNAIFVMTMQGNDIGTGWSVTQNNQKEFLNQAVSSALNSLKDSI